MSTASELLESASVAHRRSVATRLDLPAAATASEIADALRDRTRLANIVHGLSEEARRLAARAAFHGDPSVRQSWSDRGDPTAGELESHGLAVAFRNEYRIEYHVPHDLHGPLADVLAEGYVHDLEPAEPVRWLNAAPVQLAHDLAAAWAYIARSTVRVKADGPVYQRDTPKLLSALPGLELHRPDDPIATYRLQFVLDVLSEEELVSLRVANLPGAGGRRELAASGDILGLLGRAPAALRERMLSHAGVASLGAAALGLSRRLDPDAPVAIPSFGSALRAAV